MDRRHRSLWLVWVALLLLLALTAGSAKFRLGAWNSAINLAIALAKALLVALVFMRLRHGHALVKVAAVTGLAALALLFALGGSDYATRQVAPAPWQQPSTVPAKLGVR